MSSALKDVSETVTSIVSQVTNKSTNSDSAADPTDPAQLVATIGEIFQSKDTQEKFAAAAKTASSVFGPMLSGNPPQTESVVEEQH